MKEIIPTQNENPKGLHQKYFIQKIVPNPKYGVESTDTFMGEDVTPEFILKDVDVRSEYFVMRLDEGGSDPKHINACRIGVLAYANAIKNHLPDLANDLIERYSSLSPNEAEGEKEILNAELKIMDGIPVCIDFPYFGSTLRVTCFDEDTEMEISIIDNDPFEPTIEKETTLLVVLGIEDVQKMHRFLTASLQAESTTQPAGTFSREEVIEFAEWRDMVRKYNYKEYFEYFDISGEGSGKQVRSKPTSELLTLFTSNQGK